MFVLQSEASTDVEIAANDIQFLVEVTGANMRPVVKMQHQDLTG